MNDACDLDQGTVHTVSRASSIQEVEPGDLTWLSTQKWAARHEQDSVTIAYSEGGTKCPESVSHPKVGCVTCTEVVVG